MVVVFNLFVVILGILAIVSINDCTLETFQAATEVMTVAALFGQHWQKVGLPHPIPIACVGCGDADKVRAEFMHLS